MAESLLRSVSEAGVVQQDGTSLTLDQEQKSGHVPERMTSQSKRAQVSAACEPCRRRKMKCDALRPCTSCVRRKCYCVYETQDGETHSQAYKRRYDEMAHSHDTYAELFAMLRNRSQRDAAEVLRRIQSGHQPEAILKFLKRGDVTSTMPDPRRVALEAFLVNLAHSTGSLQDIIRFASLTLDPFAQNKLPSLSDFHSLRNRTVHVGDVENLLERSKRLGSIQPAVLTNGTAESPSNSARSSSDTQNRDLDVGGDIGRDDEPPHQVPAAPWTTITENSEAISHLVSIFLAWINPTWRFVEQDLFLFAMRSKQLDSEFCSPFLVNSICAIACIHSEHEVAFAPKCRDRVTRGLHFHDEALRLWTLEECSPTLTNMQALCVLSLESNYRAKDRLGLTLVPIAADLNNEVPLHCDETRCAIQGISKHDYARARLSTYWTVICTHMLSDMSRIMRIAFMNGAKAESRASGLPKIHDLFQDRVEFWIGYPLARNAVPHRPTLYLRERCKLAGLFQELHDLIFTPDKQRSVSIRGFASAVDLLSAKMQHWYEYLPFELHYDWPMSVAIWELHASYLAFLMILWLEARTRYQQKPELPDGQGALTDADDEDSDFRSRKAQDALTYAIPLAHKAAQNLRDFRERYGLKVTPAWLLQLQAVTAGVLLKDPDLSNPATATSPRPGEPSGTIEDSHAAFDEVFRCLLGTGVEVMIARGIARMMYHTALEQKIALSRSTRSMLQIMSDTAWRPSDLSLVNSVFPNFASTKGHENRERMTELLSKWEKLEI